MRNLTLIEIALLFGTGAAGLAQEQEAPATRVQVGIGRVGKGVDQLGLGVGVDPQLYSKPELLKIPEILEEIQATDEQKEKLKEADKQLKLDVSRIYQKIQDEKGRLKEQGGQEAELTFRQQTLTYAGQLTRDFERPLLKVLDRSQIKRLEQIQIRADGYLAFSVAEVIDRLGLMPNQATEIAACVAEGRKNVREAAWSYRDASLKSVNLPEDQKQAQLTSPAFQTTALKAQTAVIEARMATLREIRKVLTNSQQATFKNMAGPPFDFDKLNPIRADKLASPTPTQKVAN